MTSTAMAAVAAPRAAKAKATATQGGVGTRASVRKGAAAPERKAAQRHRAQKVSLAQRAARVVCGSPSVSRAAGGVGTSLRPRALRGRAWQQRREAVPVFAVDRKGPWHAERLPRIWVTEPAFDTVTGQRCGRAYVGAYPTDPDRGGWRAFELGSRYFAEGLACGPAGGAGAAEGSAAVAARHRIDCFRAAEVLFLHSARRGNLKACAKLGAIYGGDLCEGRYWQGLLEARAGHFRGIDPARKAFAWLSRAALKADSEACRQLGDLLLEGRGCTVDEQRAFTLFTRALLHAEGPEQAGFAALRLADCYAQARGCRLSFERAGILYQAAAEQLQAAFDEGSWYCKRPLLQARQGRRRMAQELSGRY